MLDQLKQVDNRRLYQQIADQIRAFIDKGNYTPGARLPPERDLAQQLGVSRPSVREALIALEIEGSVEVRMGAGVYVCSVAQRKPQALDTMGESPIELMQARAAIEGTVILQACAKATPEALAALRQILDNMLAAMAQNRSPLVFDRQFHQTIAAMTGNAVLERLVCELFDERHSPIAARLSAHSESGQTWATALQEHEAILRALENRDVLAAQTALRMHLQASEQRWVENNRREWS
ncbi:FadR family transcriptional regulator [Hydrogenophaga taeniospiralis]|uniref:FadR/GntR family transcriptional regulator n=1 Tax=Hydrogenophaga taeniospiralis TaxID=65656 RepID=UPI001CF9EF95|nr:FadR/GntR family transcriptional regulator [Hydrogenophaga taeniospiralis]MCB4363355.1 FadR family transcriptional regulator [Hydrogenophaga taeniospiralis]